MEGELAGVEKPIRLSRHASEQARIRGATEAEIIEAIRTGEVIPAKRQRVSFRKNFQFNALWAGKWYAIKQVMAVVVEEPEEFVVVTVYAFYF